MSFNTRLGLVVSLIVLVLAVRLVLAAADSGNWTGFYFSFVHVAAVAGGVYISLRRKEA